MTDVKLFEEVFNGGFRLLTEYHSFLLEKIFGVNYKEYQFPSPYEVIFTFILYSKKNCIIINF